MKLQDLIQKLENEGVRVKNLDVNLVIMESYLAGMKHGIELGYDTESYKEGVKEIENLDIKVAELSQ